MTDEVGDESRSGTYEEFRLRIERGPSKRTYRVYATGPTGQVEGLFKLPFSDLELENFILKVRGTRSGVRSLQSTEADLAKEFGTELFDALFATEVRGLYRACSVDAANHHQGLRISIGLTSVPELLRIPWEFLYDKPTFPSTDRRTPIVRYLDLPRPIKPFRIQLPLRILAVVSSPLDAEPIDAEKEAAKLDEALRPLTDKGAVVCDWLPEASLSALYRVLSQADHVGYHILHFIGHGGFAKGAKEGVLLFEDEKRARREESGDRLGAILHSEDSLRLVVLNSCEGARSSVSDPFSGVATSLIEHDIPAVIGMQFEITDRAAILFSAEFYRALAEGRAVDESLSQARMAIFADNNDIEWGTPVLFTRVTDGRLFDVQSEAVPAPAQQGIDAAEAERRRLEAAAAAAEPATEERAAPAEPATEEAAAAEPPSGGTAAAEPATEEAADAAEPATGWNAAAAVVGLAAGAAAVGQTAGSMAGEVADRVGGAVAGGPPDVPAEGAGAAAGPLDLPSEGGPSKSETAAPAAEGQPLATQSRATDVADEAAEDERRRQAAEAADTDAAERERQAAVEAAAKEQEAKRLEMVAIADAERSQREAEQGDRARREAATAEEERRQQETAAKAGHDRAAATAAATAAGAAAEAKAREAARRRRLLLGAGAGIAVLAVVAVMLLFVLPGSGPALDVSSATGSPPVAQVTGKGFDPGEAVVLKVGSTVVGTVTAASDGTFETSIAIPPDAGSPLTVDALGQTSRRSASHGFAVVPSAGASATAISPTIGPAGSQAPGGSAVAPTASAGQSEAVLPSARPLIVYYSDVPGPHNSVYTVDPVTKERIPLTDGTFDDTFPAWSPDRSRIAFTHEPTPPVRGQPRNRDILTMDPNGKNVEDLVADPTTDDWFPAWSQDGTLAFVRGSSQIWIKKKDQAPELYFDGKDRQVQSPAWAPNGDLAFFANWDNVDNYDIYVIHPDRRLERLTSGLGVDRNPTYSPDGSKIAYVHGPPEVGPDRSGRDLFLMDATTHRVIRQLTGQDPQNGQGVQDGNPVWSPDGTTIAFYRAVGSNRYHIMTIGQDGNNEIDLMPLQAGQNLDPNWR